MSFVHDLIKIKLSESGFLPNYPPHLISDDEMCDAFLSPEYSHTSTDAVDYFHLQYPCFSKDLSIVKVYTSLVKDIRKELNAFKADLSESRVLPDWVYSYMLGQVVGPNSDTIDIHDLLELLGVDNIDDRFTLAAAKRCYSASVRWLRRYGNQVTRTPTIFGEPHVIKCLRLLQVEAISNTKSKLVDVRMPQ